MSVLDEADRIVADLRAAGVRATDDPRSAQSMPCALLQRPAMVPLGNLCQNLRIEWSLWLLVSGGDNRATWRALETMRERVWAVLKQQITGCDPDIYPINEKADVPAYRITFETVI